MKIYFRYNNQNITHLELNIEKTYSIGRSLTCDVQIPFSTVSRFQGVLFFEQGSWKYRDESSSKYRDESSLKNKDEGSLKSKAESSSKLPSPNHSKTTGKDLLSQFNDDNSHSTVVTLSDSVSVNLKNGLEIFLDSFLANEKTHFYDEPKKDHSQKKYNWKFASAAISIAVLFLATGFYIYKTQYKAFDSKTLMSFSENKILKFEVKVKKEVLEKIKKEADLKEEDFKESVGFCTGFLVDKNIILTAHHCVSPPPGLTIEKDFILKTFDNREITPKRILGFDFTKDYLFMEVEGFNDNPSFKITDKIEIGQKVFTIGNVAGEGLAIREGIISGETEDPNDPAIKYVRFSAAASPGNSGGPLLNERGEVVALVSRKNMSENYNIGISYKDLQNGFNQFVTNKNPKEIIYDSKQNDMGFGGLEFYLGRVFRLPSFEKLESKPELQEKLNKMVVKFQVPFEFKDSNQNYFEKFHQVAKSKIDEISILARKENLPGFDWEQQTTKDLPYIIPSTTSDSNLSFKMFNNQYLLPKTVGLIGNSRQSGYDFTLNDWKKEKLYLYNEGFMATKGQLIEERIENTLNENYLVYSSVKDSKEPIDISRFFIVSPDFSIVYLNSEFDTTKRENLILKTMKDIFIGPEGAVVSLRYFPFLRPKAKADFKIKNFPSNIVKVKTFQDRNSKNWDYYIADFYDAFYLELFCTNSPRSTHCLTTLQEGSKEKMKEEVVKNFVNFELNEKFSLMDFYPTEMTDDPMLKSYFKTAAPYKDLEFKQNAKNELMLDLPKFNYTLNLGPKNNIVSFRTIPGVKHNETSNSGNWQTFGIQFIRKEKTKSSTKNEPFKFELCTAGVQFEELKYNAMLTRDSFIQKSFRGIASENNLSPKSKDKKTETVWKKNLGSDEKNWKKQAYGTCQTLEKDPEKPDVYRAEFESRSFKAGE